MKKRLNFYVDKDVIKFMMKGQTMKTMSAVLFIVLAGIPMFSMSASYQKTIVSETEFETELAAVLDSSQNYIGLSVKENREYGGAIIINAKGKYLYTVSQGKRNQEQLKIRFVLNKGEKVKAFWHTHGGQRPWREYFSEKDMRLVESTGRPLYLFTPKRYLKVLKPGFKSFNRLMSRQMGLPRGEAFAPGKILIAPN